MTEDPFTIADPERERVEIDAGSPHAARIYDYLCGGNTWFRVDKEAADRAFSQFPGGLEVAKANARINRNFLGRASRYLAAEAGVRQFLDLGCGIPTWNNPHEIVGAVHRASRILYVDKDPTVLAHAHALMRSVTPEQRIIYLQEDFREPELIVRKAVEFFDLDEPVALMVVSILHMVPDQYKPYEIVDRMLEPLPSGSYMAMSHFAADIEPEAMGALSGSLQELEELEEKPALRPREEVRRFFDGLELVEPGLVNIDGWLHPEDYERDKEAIPGLVYPFYAGIARKP